MVRNVLGGNKARRGRDPRHAGVTRARKTKPRGGGGTCILIVVSSDFPINKRSIHAKARRPTQPTVYNSY